MINHDLCALQCSSGAVGMIMGWALTMPISCDTPSPYRTLDIAIYYDKRMGQEILHTNVNMKKTYQYLTILWTYLPLSLIHRVPFQSHTFHYPITVEPLMRGHPNKNQRVGV